MTATKLQHRPQIAKASANQIQAVALVLEMQRQLALVKKETIPTYAIKLAISNHQPAIKLVQDVKFMIRDSRESMVDIFGNVLANRIANFR